MGAPFGNQNAKGHGCGRPKFWTNEKIIEEADYLIAWAKRDDSLVMGSCYGSRGYTMQHAALWCKDNEYFRDAKELAKTIVGARREHGALIGEYDASFVRTSQAIYDPEYRAFLKEMKRDQIIEDIQAEEAAKKLSDMIKSQPQIKSCMDDCACG